MKKLIVTLILIFLCAQHAFTQKEDTKLRFNSISINPLGIYLDDNTGGFAASLDVSLKTNNHLFKLFVLTGSEFSILDSRKESFVEYDFLYGKEFTMAKWFYIDLFGGLGYYHHQINVIQTSSMFINLYKVKNNTSQTGNYSIREGRVGFPLQARIRFQPAKVFSFGLQFHGNVNSINSIFNTGIFFQWKFR